MNCPSRICIRTTFLSACVFTVCLSILSGCVFNVPTLPSRDLVRGQLVDQALLDDEAQAEIANDIMLLNILRAYDEEPFQYLQVQQWQQAIPTLNGTFERDIGGPSIEDSKAQVQVQSGTSSGSINPLAGKKFEQGFTSPVTASTVHYFLAEGFPTSVVLHLFVHDVRVHAADDRVVDRYVNSPMSAGESQRFDALINSLSACVDISLSSLPTDPSDSVGPAVGAGAAADLKAQVKVAAAKLVLVPVGAPNSSTSKSPSPTTRTQGSTTKAPALTSYMLIAKPDKQLELGPSQVWGQEKHGQRIQSDQFSFLDNVCNAAYAATIGRYKKPSPNQSPQKAPWIELQLRSPEAAIYYLGELVRRGYRGSATAVAGDAAKGKGAFDSTQAQFLSAVVYAGRGCHDGDVTECYVHCAPLFVTLRKEHTIQDWDGITAARCPLLRGAMNETYTPPPGTQEPAAGISRPTIETPWPDCPLHYKTDSPLASTKIELTMASPVVTGKAPETAVACIAPVTIAEFDPKSTEASDVRVIRDGMIYAIPKYTGEDSFTSMMFTLVQIALQMQTESDAVPTAGYVHVVP